MSIQSVATTHTSIRIHPNPEFPNDIQQDFQNYCNANSIDDYVMTYEDDAARPHYHTYINSTLSLWKLKQSFKKLFPYLKGNKHFAFTMINDVESFKKYICKAGDYKLHSINYTVEDLDKYKTEWLKVKGELAQANHNKIKKNQKKIKDIQDQFIQDLNSYVKINKELHKITTPKEFPSFLKEFILRHSIYNYNRNFIEKYYRLFLKNIDIERYKVYLEDTIRSIVENNMY